MIVANPPVSTDKLTRIVEAAALAPSAENLQPWRFGLKADCVVVSLDLTRQLPSDVGRMLGLTGVGAAIENAMLAASQEKLLTDVEYLVDRGTPGAGEAALQVARLHLETSDSAPDPLAEYIAARCTTRRMEATAVDQHQLDAIGECVRGFADAALHWVDGQRLPEFARLVGMGNRIRFEHRPFHAELYHSLRFNAVEVARTRDGLDVATLQLPFGVASIMYWLRTWPRMRVANFFGFSRGVERQATAEVLRSGAVGFITVPAAEAEMFIRGGRALERLWLTATRLGLCFHPMASLPVFLAHAREGCSQLLPKHADVSRDMSRGFSQLFPEFGERVVQMAFRVGFGQKPPVRSLRQPAQHLIDRQEC